MKVEIGPYQDWDEEKQAYVPEVRVKNIHIDKWDTWNMDRTLAMIIHPMLVQLKATKHGSSMVNDEDVPEQIRSTSAKLKKNEWDTDEFVHDRWDWVIDEMIWAFAEHCKDDGEKEFFTHHEFDENEDSYNEFQKELKIGHIDIDTDGLKKYNKRKENGFRLFGVYFHCLWS